MAKGKVVYIYPNLMAEINRHNENLQILANILGMSYQSLSKRLQGIKSFELPEITMLIKHYRRSFEYLFANEILQEKKGAWGEC